MRTRRRKWFFSWVSDLCDKSWWVGEILSWSEHFVKKKKFTRSVWVAELVVSMEESADAGASFGVEIELECESSFAVSYFVIILCCIRIVRSRSSIWLWKVSIVKIWSCILKHSRVRKNIKRICAKHLRVKWTLTYWISSENSENFKRWSLDDFKTSKYHKNQRFLQNSFFILPSKLTYSLPYPKLFCCKLYFCKLRTSILILPKFL